MDNSLRELKQYSTPTVSDALDTLGVNGGLEGIHSIVPGTKIVGLAYTLEFQACESQQGGKAADYIDHVPEGSVIVINNNGNTSCTVWGDILSYVAQCRGVQATVINGFCRDVDQIRKLGYPIFSKGRYMKSGKNRVYLSSEQIQIKIGSTIVVPGDVVFGDDSGVLSIPRNKLEEVLKICSDISVMERQVLDAYKAGLRLAEAREKYHYNRYALCVNHEN